MLRKVFAAILTAAFLAAFAACANPPQNANDTTTNPGTAQNDNNTPPDSTPDENVESIPSVGGIKLGDTKEKVQEILGEDYTEESFNEAGHFPEAFYNWEYAEGYTITLGKDSNTVLQIAATAPGARTNLNVKIGDPAGAALVFYRAQYTEPDSIQGGGKLLGVFKVEKDQALILDFNTEDGLVNPVEEIKPDETIKRIILTYPAYLDESF